MWQKLEAAIPIYKGIENTIRNASGIAPFKFVNHSFSVRLAIYLYLTYSPRPLILYR